MTVLSLPAAFKISRATWGLRANSSVFVSPLNMNAQTSELVGAAWIADIEAPPMRRATVRTIIAWLAQLRGQAGRFYLTPPGCESPIGTALGTPRIAGASQSGALLFTDGWTPGATMKAGDYLSFDTSVGRELHMVVADAAATGSPSDIMDLAIEPPIRTAPADNALITVTNPTGIFRLADDEQAKWNVEEAVLFGLGFSAVESFFGNV